VSDAIAALPRPGIAPPCQVVARTRRTITAPWRLPQRALHAATAGRTVGRVRDPQLVASMLSKLSASTQAQLSRLSQISSMPEAPREPAPTP
jgi:hypothetical protein